MNLIHRPKCFIVLDDLMNVALNSEMVERLFVQPCHHKGLSVVFITTNVPRTNKYVNGSI